MPAQQTEQSPLVTADERGLADRIVGGTLDFAGINDDTKSRWWFHPLVMTTSAALWIAFGVLCIDYFEGWTYHTGIYVIVQIVTTIGYGDITVTSQKSKLFMSLYVLITLLLIANVITEAMSNLIDYEKSKMRKVMRNMEKRVRADVHNDEDARHKFAALNDFMSAFLLFSVFVAFGTIFFATYESCTCSFGETAVPDCIEGPKCEETGGYTNSVIDAFYMSVITLTTVGFGDHSPKTPLGRVFGLVWMLLGVTVTGSLITAATGTIWSSKRVETIAGMSKELFDQMDTDSNGAINKEEFRNYLLVKFGLVANEDLQAIDSLFHVIDKCGNNDGAVSWDEVNTYCRLKKMKTGSTSS
jgi:potassium channel subfamily K